MQRRHNWLSTRVSSHVQGADAQLAAQPRLLTLRARAPTHRRERRRPGRLLGALPLLQRSEHTFGGDLSCSVSPLAPRSCPLLTQALDKLLTFLFVGFLGCLSDVVGRKPLMAYAALGQAIACLMQSEATHVSLLIAADVIDGASSCMNSVCQACSPPLPRILKPSE